MPDTPSVGLGIVAILADYLAGIANSVDEGGWPTTPECSHAVSTCPKESPLIKAGVNCGVSNYLTETIDTRGIELNITPVEILPARVDGESTQALHAVDPSPNKGLSEIAVFS